MTTQHFILFERIQDPHGETPVGVYDSLAQAEVHQLSSQQDKADSFNIRRHDAFTRGGRYSEAKQASDYANNFHITEVLTP